MTAMFKTRTTHRLVRPAQTMLDGAGVEMFSSGSLAGRASLLEGDAVGAFSSGSAPVTGCSRGCQTGLFSSGSSPRAGLARLAGDGVHLFSSGS